MTQRPEVRCIALVGPRGAGKTTVAAAVAAALGWTSDDGDELVAREVGCAAGEFLAREGEPAFRAVEERLTTAALREVDRCVLALGGGAVLSPAVRSALLGDRILAVFLRAPVSTLVMRLRADPTRRPALTELPLAEEVAVLMRDRIAWYREAAVLELDTSTQSPEECAAAIVARLS